MEEVENTVEDFPEEEDEEVPGTVETKIPLSIFKIIRNFTKFHMNWRNFAKFCFCENLPKFSRESPNSICFLLFFAKSRVMQAFVKTIFVAKMCQNQNIFTKMVTFSHVAGLLCNTKEKSSFVNFRKTFWQDFREKEKMIFAVSCKINMIWLYRSLIPIGRRRIFYLLRWFHGA